MRKIFIFLFALLAFSLSTYSQSIEERALQELERRGLGEEDVRQRLAAKGIDLNNIDINNPAEIFAIEKSVKDVIDEIEGEKAKRRVTSTTGTNSNGLATGGKRDTTGTPLSEGESKILAKEGESISEAIDEGATLEEAVSEELIEVGENELPPAKLYGQEIFRTQSIKLYRKSEDVKPPDSYILGVGDIIGVAIWGNSEEDMIFEINKNGFIKPEGIPRITLKGLNLGQVKERLKSVFSNYYRFESNQFEVTLNFGRTINVNIVGEVYNYGTFNIPAINTAFNALVAAGGPNDIGSVRNIRLLRAGEAPREMDIYKFLLDPRHADDFSLEENDIIQVPIAANSIRVKGAVIRPHVYELKNNEKLSDLLRFSGGLKINASLQNIQITRYQDNELKIIDVNLNELLKTNRDVELKNGDVVEVKTIPGEVENFASLKGAVEIPGDYAITGQTRVSDLLKRTNLKEDARIDQVFLKRLNTDNTSEYMQLNLKNILANENDPDNIVLKSKDIITIYTNRKFIDNETFSIGGHVRDGGEYPYDISKSLKIKDAIFMSGGLKKNATDFAYVKRKSDDKLKQTQYLRIDLNSDNDLNIEIQPQDEIVVYNKADFIEDKNVSVSGAVKKVGTFQYDETLRVSDLIVLSGGLNEYATDFAYLKRINLSKPKQVEYFRIDLTSSDVDNFALQPNDVIRFYSQLEFLEEKTITIEGAVKNNKEFKYDESLTLKDVITMAGGLDFNASRKRVDIYRTNFGDEQKTNVTSKLVIIDENDEPINGNFQLMPFDRIIVRNAPEYEEMKIVNVKGEVKYPGIYPILGENEKLMDVINRAGGVTDEAFFEGIKLYRSKGEESGFISVAIDQALKNPKSYQNVIISENDEIVIPKRKNLVSIVGETKLYEVYDDRITRQGKLTVPYIPRKNAMHYVRNYAGGVDKDGDKNRIYVFYPDGKIKKTKRFLGIRFYPKVEKGSLIKVGAADPEKDDLAAAEKEKVDWESTFAKILTQTTAVLTLILLARRATD